MKRLKIIIAATLAIIFIGCKKLVPNNENTLLYTENINNLKKGEPLSLTFGDDDVVDKVTWTISPNTNNTINTIANNAAITFSAAGNYKVTATMGNVYAVYNVTVDAVNYLAEIGNAFTMQAPKFVGIIVNEPVVFTVYNAKAGNAIGWALYTTIPYTIIRDDIKKTATIIFAGSGAATIYADDGVSTDRKTVWIGDATNPSLTNNDFIIGDKLQLTPFVEQTNTGKRLSITAKTTRKYHCDTDKILSFSVNNEYEIDYSGVAISTQICGKRSVATATNSFKNMAVGKHPFAVNFANKTYRGTVTLDAFGKYTFDWQDASVVSIYPLVVN